jgi:hypothetical protein
MTMPKTLKAVWRIDRLRVWQDGGVIELMDAILAQAKSAVAPPKTFHQLTPDEQAAFYIFISGC